MDRECDAAYLQRMAREEYGKAENAPDPVAYRRHIELARTFERRARLARRGDKDPPR